MTQPWGLHWFRRDLKIEGNDALQGNFERHQGRVLGLFTFDETFLNRADFSHQRFQFFLDTLNQLRRTLQNMGGDLLVLGTGPDQSFELLKNLLCESKHALPSTISWNRDYEPFARARDQRAESYFRTWSAEILTARNHLLIEPHEILKSDQKPYQVYSAFAKAWFAKLHTQEVQLRINRQKSSQISFDQNKNRKVFRLTWKDVLGTHIPEDQWASVALKNRKMVSIPIPEAGAHVGRQKIAEFAPLLAEYGTKRDVPSIAGTSRLSMFFKNGSVTVPQVIAAYNLGGLTFKAGDGATKFLQELVWREFYYYILWHSPRVEHEAFQTQYKDLSWDNDPERFEAWKLGQTGYPIVDAGMRELLTTGWMHNRVRMIVASFLTKDLLVDWKWGEAWFMNKLLDGDLAPNNGGWQWAASTGCDAQPYFRIFNPQSQSERFDPEGIYIRRFVPELSEVDTKNIHNPSDALRAKHGYPAPIVDHGHQRILALKLYKR